MDKITFPCLSIGFVTHKSQRAVWSKLWCLKEHKADGITIILDTYPKRSRAERAGRKKSEELGHPLFEWDASGDATLIFDPSKERAEQRS
jgi:hypothetical protein